MIGSHGIPRFYLEQFAGPPKRKGKPGNVWVYEKGKAPQARSTRSQGYENGYFGFFGPNGKIDESLETRLAVLENRCNEVLVCSRSPLFDWSSSHKSTLAFYAALLFARSTSRKKFSSGNWKKLAEPYARLALNEKYLRDVANHFTRDRGMPTDPTHQVAGAWIYQSPALASAWRPKHNDARKNTKPKKRQRQTNYW